MASSSDADMLARLPTALLDGKQAYYNASVRPVVMCAAAELVSDILHVAPSLRPTFLSSLGSRIHASAVRISFCVLVVPDDARLFEGATRPGSPRSAVSPLLANPDRYALAVKELVVSEPDASDMVAAKHTEQGDLAVDLRRPLDSKDVSRILEACSQLEKLTWASSFVPPDGLCEVIFRLSAYGNVVVCSLLGLVDVGRTQSPTCALLLLSNPRIRAFIPTPDGWQMGLPLASTTKHPACDIPPSFSPLASWGTVTVRFADEHGRVFDVGRTFYRFRLVG